MIPLTVVCALQLLLIIYVIRDRKAEREADRNERRELTSRVQRPEFVPPQHGGPARVASKPHPNLGKIGGFAPREDSDAAA